MWYWYNRSLLTRVFQVYGDPLEHPQTETYWGNVNCNGERSCYDEGKRAAECLTFDYKREHNTDVSVHVKEFRHTRVYSHINWLQSVCMLVHTCVCLAASTLCRHQRKR